MKIPKKLLYTKDHLWFRKIGLNDYYVGITDYAQKEIGSIDLIVLDKFEKLKSEYIWGKIYGTNQIFQLKFQFDFRILENNPDLDLIAPRVNTDPYGQWFVILTIENYSTYFLTNHEYLKFVQ